MPISYKVIGRHIRDARKSAGLTQEAAANQLGLSPEHYGKVERGERTVNLERMVQISHLYGTTVCAPLEGFDTEATAAVTRRPAGNGCVSVRHARNCRRLHGTKPCAHAARMRRDRSQRQKLNTLDARSS